ncbi:MAG: ankyrin repeat domain-containing protein [Candidatus Manganitrophus sp. SA1]|nr:ankyrin repeat domain-containing protein [Candidatus Manganitrophus morganii]
MNQQLVAAASNGNASRVIELLRKGADVNTRGARGRTPMMAAAYRNHVETVAALIDAGADVNLQDNMLNNPFLYAGAEGLLDILKLTVKAGADPKMTNRFGGTALIPAAERGHVEVVKYLLTHTNMDINHVNNLGWTALLEAIVLSDGGPKHQEIVAVLIQHGADVNIPDHAGHTPLYHAKERGYVKIQILLQAAGARPLDSTRNKPR